MFRNKMRVTDSRLKRGLAMAIITAVVGGICLVDYLDQSAKTLAKRQLNAQNIVDVAPRFRIPTDEDGKPMFDPNDVRMNAAFARWKNLKLDEDIRKRAEEQNKIHLEFRENPVNFHPGQNEPQHQAQRNEMEPAVNNENSGVPKRVAQLLPDQKVPRNFEDFVRFDPEICRQQQWVGGYERGAHPWRVCMDGVRPDQCRVYSFGFNAQFSFDIDMAEKRCEVEAFDPTVPLSQHPHTGVGFHHLGVADENSDQWNGLTNQLVGAAPWRVRTIQKMMESLNDESLDIVKMDLKGGEWAVLSQALGTGSMKKVRQLLVEAHVGEPNDQWQNVLQKLYDIGFRAFYLQPGCPASTSLPNMDQCYQISLVRTDF
eukprot:comp17834_c0_seq1/m.17978 comp17834_c0_seq1/g.17978  ORF comp17834_c0_seq1/g.17978 comp17834_c0_seq1/m.17978 type:complete len:371 (-) comp17834_c0_seq1:316-1428(-)